MAAINVLHVPTIPCIKKEPNERLHLFLLLVVTGCGTGLRCVVCNNIYQLFRGNTSCLSNGESLKVPQKNKSVNALMTVACTRSLNVPSSDSQMH